MRFSSRAVYRYIRHTMVVGVRRMLSVMCFARKRRRVLFLCQNALMAEYLNDIYDLLKIDSSLKLRLRFCPSLKDDRPDVSRQVQRMLPLDRVSRLAASLLPWDLVITADHIGRGFGDGRRVKVLRISHGALGNLTATGNDYYFGRNSLGRNKLPLYARMFVASRSDRDYAVKKNAAFMAVVWLVIHSLVRPDYLLIVLLSGGVSVVYSIYLYCFGLTGHERALVSSSILGIIRKPRRAALNAEAAPLSQSLWSNNNEALVSIIIPSYNMADSLPRAISSALSQEWRPLEVIVVNDGSTDDTETVCRGLEGSIRWFSQSHAGAGAARNRGIREAGGRVVGFLDADDELLPGMVSALWKALDAQPDAGAASGVCNVLSRGRNWRLPDERLILSLGRKRAVFYDYFAAFEHRHFVATGSLLIRREVLDDAGMFNENLQAGEDQELWARIGGRYPWAFIDREVMIYNHTPKPWRRSLPGNRADQHWLYSEQTMRSQIRRELWESYRIVRRKTVLNQSRNLLSNGLTFEARILLDHFSLNNKSVFWTTLRCLAACPPPVVRAVARTYSAVKQVAVVPGR